MGFSKLKERVFDWWYSLSGAERSKAVSYAAVSGIVLMLFGFYYLNNGEEQTAYTPPEPETQEWENYLDKDIDQRINTAVEQQVKLIKGDLLLELAKEEDDVEDPFEKTVAEEIGFPPAVISSANNNEPPQTDYPSENDTAEEIPLTFNLVGEISSDSTYSPKKKSSKEEGVTEIKLPAGFMKAKLLIGIRAQTAQGASSNPKPVHLRVQAPAQLPNDIKMNLSGCFVIANTWGNLAIERIEGELVSIQCITRDKKTFIEGQIDGYIADSDGIRDMGGRVVTKAGAIIARKAVIDTLSGIGKSIENNAGSVSQSALGSVKTFDGKESLEAGLAGGAVGGLKGATDFLSELIQQSGPIIESGSAKDVMLMLQSTATLKIYKYKEL